MKIGIVGRGAIGVHLAYLVACSKKHSITLFTRPSTPAIDPVFLVSTEGVEHSLSLRQQTLTRENLVGIELLILPIKHYQVAPTLEQLSGILPPTTALILLHNGMGTKELAQTIFPTNPLLLGITTDGVYQVSANRFIQTAVGKLELGITNEVEQTDRKVTQCTERFIAEQIAIKTAWINKLKGLHPNLIWRDDIEFAQYQKLAINAVINPLTALNDCKNGELANYKDDVEIIKNEVFDLYEFMNLPIDTHTLSTTIDEVIRLTANNYSSMHQDFHLNRQTEIDGILGFLKTKAEDTGMRLPLIDRLYEELSRRQKQ